MCPPFLYKILLPEDAPGCVLPVSNALRSEHPLPGKGSAKLESGTRASMGDLPSAVCHSAISHVHPKCGQRVLAAKVLPESPVHTDADLSPSLLSF